MKTAANSIGDYDMEALRRGIKNKYRQYNLADRDRFPDFDYNTNRINYEPLRESFDEEFYVVRGLDRTNTTIHIPSTNTLALIFSEASYVPKKKILNTCRSYAEGRTQDVASQPLQTPAPTTATQRPINRKLLLASLVCLIGIGIYVVIHRLRMPNAPTGLTMSRPHEGEHSPRLLTVEGKVSNADTVWLVVHPSGWSRNYVPPVGWDKYYVQPPIKVKRDGTWNGQVYIGSETGGEIGVTYQIRAFVNPEKGFKLLDNFDDHVFDAWPDAQLSTKLVNVTR